MLQLQTKCISSNLEWRMKLILRFQKENPITRDKITVWCRFSFPPVFLWGDLPCRLQFQSVSAKNRYLVLPAHSTSREHRDQCWGPTMRHPTHQKQAALADQHPCRRKHLKSKGAPLGVPRVAGEGAGGSGCGVAVCLSAFPSSRACPGTGTAASGANCWVHLVQLALT